MWWYGKEVEEEAGKDEVMRASMSQQAGNFR